MDDFIDTDEGGYLYVKRPRVYDQNVAVNSKYFESILNGECRIKIINGVEMEANFLCSIYCDVCKEYVENGDYNYCYVCHCDICENCITSHEHTENLRKRTIDGNPCIICEFGSLLDWVPVVIDEDDNMILVNANPESQYHGKYALSSIDCHGRRGYYTIWESTTLDTLTAEMSTFPKIIDDNGWDSFYAMPIKMMMIKRKMHVYYG